MYLKDYCALWLVKHGQFTHCLPTISITLVTIIQPLTGCLKCPEMKKKLKKLRSLLIWCAVFQPKYNQNSINISVLWNLKLECFCIFWHPRHFQGLNNSEDQKKTMFTFISLRAWKQFVVKIAYIQSLGQFELTLSKTPSVQFQYL